MARAVAEERFGAVVPDRGEVRLAVSVELGQRELTHVDGGRAQHRAKAARAVPRKHRDRVRVIDGHGDVRLAVALEASDDQAPGQLAGREPLRRAEFARPIAEQERDLVRGAVRDDEVGFAIHVEVGDGERRVVSSFRHRWDCGKHGKTARAVAEQDSDLYAAALLAEGDDEVGAAVAVHIGGCRCQ